jgi:hypothetical protein
MTNEEVERWAMQIVPIVFRAEDSLLRKHPAWNDRLHCLANGEEDPSTVANDYCKAVANEIVEMAYEHDNKKDE